MSSPSESPRRHLKAYSIALRVVAAFSCVAVLGWVGRWFGAEVEVLELWVRELGFWGPLVFAALFVLLTGLQVPESALAIAAGVAFGLPGGLALVVAANGVAAVVWFWVARKLLRGPLQRALERHEKLAAIERATAEEGFRLLVLLRLGPFSFGFLNFMLGASDVRFGPYLLALVGVIPGNFATVYFGSVATHVAKKAADADDLSNPHFGVMIAGFVVTIVVVAFVAHVARKALREAQA